jgi:hypothetical protein
MTVGCGRDQRRFSVDSYMRHGSFRRVGSMEQLPRHTTALINTVLIARRVKC